MDLNSNKKSQKENVREATREILIARQDIQETQKALNTANEIIRLMNEKLTQQIIKLDRIYMELNDIPGTDTSDSASG